MAQRRTVYATHPRYTDHDFRGHPENADRIRAVWRGLDESGLSARMQSLQPEPVDTGAILAVHSAEYLDMLGRVSALDRITFLDADTYVGPDALTIARLSAGGVVGAVDAVLTGRADNGLAAIRPPGHHAVADRGMGFCLLGNVAIAARHAQTHHDVDRVLIIDYDVHHGNGTEAMFYEDPSVLYISVHQQPLYPGTGAATDIGAGPGAGYTLNIPLPPASGDTGYATVFDRIVSVAAERFGPQLILVSLGFDAYWADPLAGMQLTLSGYSHLAAEVMRIAQRCCAGRVVFALEGGYHPDALRDGVSNVARILLGEPPTDPLGPPPRPRPEPDISAVVSTIQSLHRL
ncbi:histone deacetylase family protein [Mycobacterium botniense]|nr:histone deacetylase [Mycobacterium botniense]